MRVGIIGTGRIGRSVARLLARAGHDAKLSFLATTRAWSGSYVISDLARPPERNHRSKA